MINIKNQKILLVRNDNIGDLICTTPAIEALLKRYSNIQIDIVVNSYNYDAIHNNHFINKIYCYTKPKHKIKIIDKIKAGLGKLKILLAIKKENYDIVVVFRSDYSKSAEIFSKITNAKYKIGVKNPNGKDNYNIHISNDNSCHEVEFCFNCLKPLNVAYKNEKTHFYIDKQNSSKYIILPNKIIFHISARMQKNQMSFNKLKTIFKALNREIYITAEPKDFYIAKNLENETNVKFIKTTSFLNLGEVIIHSKLFITLEGGAMHLGPALGVKTMALFGSSNIDKWYPWGYKKLVIQDISKKAENIDNELIIERIKRLS